MLYEMFNSKSLTYGALCILNLDASLRTLSTNATGCFFTNEILPAVAEIDVSGEFYQKLS